MLKHCKRCDETKDAEQFGKNRSAKDGLQYLCKPCHSTSVRESTKRHPETRKSWKSAWTPEQRRKYNEQIQRWRNEHPFEQKLIEMQKQARYAWRKAGLRVDDFQYREVLKRDGWICYLCGDAVLECSLSFDHVIPMSQGGPHTFDNVKVVHIRCNDSKGGRLASEARWMGSFYAKDPRKCHRKDCDLHD